MREGGLGRISGDSQWLITEVLKVAHNFGLILAIEVLRNGTQCSILPSAGLRDDISRKYVPNGRNANFGALWVLQQSLEELEKLLGVLLETLDDVLENGKEDVYSDLTVSDLG